MHVSYWFIHYQGLHDFYTSVKRVAVNIYMGSDSCQFFVRVMGVVIPWLGIVYKTNNANRKSRYPSEMNKTRVATQKCNIIHIKMNTVLE